MGGGNRSCSLGYGNGVSGRTAFVGVIAGVSGGDGRGASGTGKLNGTRRGVYCCYGSVVRCVGESGTRDSYRSSLHRCSLASEVLIGVSASGERIRACCK